MSATNKEAFLTAMNVLAESINSKAGTFGRKTVEQMKNTVDNISTTASGQTKTVALSMASGNQVITPDAGKVLTQVTITKPSTLIAGNIRSGVTIGGVTGTYGGGGTTYSITTSVTHGSYVGATTMPADTTYVSSTATVTISASSGYTRPSYVVVSGANYTYDSTTGAITLRNPTGNITITAVCQQMSGYSGSISKFTTASMENVATYIKFDDIPNSATDYDAYVDETGELSGATSYSNASYAYVWSDSGCTPSVKINNSVQSFGYLDWDYPAEIQLQGNYTIYLGYGH